MARKPRIDFPGAWHHVMHRGARRGIGIGLGVLGVACLLPFAVGGVAWIARLRSGGHPAIVGAPYVLLSVYLPALVVVLRQANTGDIPDWLERRVQALPSWLRGSKE